MGKPRHREALLSSLLLSPYVPSKKKKKEKTGQLVLPLGLGRVKREIPALLPSRVTYSKASAHLGLGNHTGGFLQASLFQHFHWQSPRVALPWGWAVAPRQLCSGPALFQGRRFMYYMWLYFLEHLCFSLSKLGPCLDDLWGGGKCKLELLIYSKLIKLCLMQTACLLLPLSISRTTLSLIHI